MSNEKQVYPVTKTSETTQNCCFFFFFQTGIYIQMPNQNTGSNTFKTFDQFECLVTYYFY